ncbi:hypothetical protein TorRG33x02_217560 [Trema orientale]|uniref:Pentatricopeptide repeat n=1 Tax=Trema orientale TaxID=63057 RepID=A0A2P5EAF4_TREOI|nr:hypothetical protein TorRG33x02_217560 [Trema orientale]
MTLRQLRGNGQLFWRTGIGQALGIGTASSHFRSVVAGNRPLTMTARCVDNLQTKEELQPLWTMFRSEIEPISAILGYILLEIPSKDFVYWYAMFLGHAQYVASYEALYPFNEIISRGWLTFGQVLLVCNNSRLLAFVVPYVALMIGDHTLVSFLAACLFLGAMVHGNWVNSFLTRCGLECDMVLGTSMINMSTDGRVEQANKVFKEMPESDTSAYTSLISLLTIHEFSPESNEFVLGGRLLPRTKLFGTMELSCVKMIHVTFLGLLSACSQVGWVEKSRWHLIGIKHSRSSELQDQCYACLIDIFRRPKLFSLAERVFRCVRFWATTLFSTPSMLRRPSGVMVWLGNLTLWHASDCAMTLQHDTAAVRVQLYQPVRKGGPPPNVHLEDKVILGGGGIDKTHTCIT